MKILPRMLALGFAGVLATANSTPAQQPPPPSPIGFAAPASPEPPQPDTICYRTMFAEMRGLEWRSALHAQLKPVAHQNATTVWTISHDMLPNLLERSAQVLAAPKVTAESDHDVTLVPDAITRQYVAQMNRIADGPPGQNTRLSFLPDVEKVCESLQVHAAGRRLDHQGVLAHIAVSGSQVLAMHQVTIKEEVQDGGVKQASHTLGTHYQVPELAECHATGDWLIPSDAALVIGLGVHTVADKGQAVVCERLVILEVDREPQAPGGGPLAAAFGSARPPLPPPLPNPMPMPAPPSRALPLALAPDGTETEALPPLPDEHATRASHTTSAEPQPSPQSRHTQANAATPKRTSPGLEFPRTSAAEMLASATAAPSTPKAAAPLDLKVVPAQAATSEPHKGSISISLRFGPGAGRLVDPNTKEVVTKVVNLTAPRPLHAAKVEPVEYYGMQFLTLPEALRIGLCNEKAAQVIALGAQGQPDVISLGDAQTLGARSRADLMAFVRSVEQQHAALAAQQTRVTNLARAVRQCSVLLSGARNGDRAQAATPAETAAAQQRLEKLRLEQAKAVSDQFACERQLRGLLGLPASQSRRLVAISPPRCDSSQLDWNTCLAQMNGSHPQIALARDEVARVQACVAAERFCVMPSPLGLPCGDLFLAGLRMSSTGTLAEAEYRQQQAQPRQVVHQSIHSLARRFVEVQACDQAGDWNLTLTEAVRIGLSHVAHGPDSVIAGGARHELPAADRQQAYEHYRAAFMEFVRSIDSVYGELAFEQERIQCVHAALDLCAKASHAQGRNEAHSTNEPETQAIHTRVERLRAALAQATSERANVERRLRNLLDVPAADHRRIVAAGMPKVDSSPVDWNTCLAQMNSTQPKMRLAHAQVARAEMQKALRGLWMLPSPTGVPCHALVAEGLPGSCCHSNAAAQCREQQAHLRKVVDECTHLLSRAFVERKAREERCRTAGEALSAAEDKLAAQKAAFERGRISADRFLESVERWSSAVGEEADARCALRASVVALDEAKGTLLEDEGLRLAETSGHLAAAVAAPRDASLVRAGNDLAAQDALGAEPRLATAPAAMAPRTYSVRIPLNSVMAIQVKATVSKTPSAPRMLYGSGN